MTEPDLHITGPCQAAYSRGCRCNDCRAAWREAARRRQARNKGRPVAPSPLAVEVERLNHELELLREENAALRCQLQNHEWAR